MKNLITLTLLLAFVTLTAQDTQEIERDFNKFSIEVVAGLQAPLSPNDGVSRSDYVSFNSYGAGIRYNITTNTAIRGSFYYHGFKHKDHDNLGVGFYNFTAEAVYNLGRVFNLPRNFYRNFGLLAHGGMGVTFAYSSPLHSTDHIGHLKVGLTPQVKINEYLAFFVDGSYLFNFKQHYSFNGHSLHAGKKGETGGIGTITFGLMVYFGDLNTKKPHADWYH